VTEIVRTIQGQPVTVNETRRLNAAGDELLVDSCPAGVRSAFGKIVPKALRRFLSRVSPNPADASYTT
jgi:hypothetical protein